MEEELTKTAEGQVRLERAKDRLDTKVAEIGQAEIDRQANDDKISAEMLPQHGTKRQRQNMKSATALNHSMMLNQMKRR